MTDSTIHEDVPGADDADDAVFLKRYGEEPEGREAEEHTEGEGAETPAPAEGEDDATPKGPEEGAEGEETEHLADDGHKVVIKVGDEEHKVSVADLKRLWGQEASLTKKSQEVAAAHARAEAEGEKAVTILGTLVQQAEKEWQKYAGVDLNLAAQRLDEASYKQLRADMQAAWNHVAFLKQEANGYVEQVRQNRVAAHQQALSKVDEAMAKDIPGWTAAQRTEIVDYAIKEGLDAGIAKALADPAAIKLLRKAMQFDKGAAAIKGKVTPVATSAPNKTLKPGAKGQSGDSDKSKDALARLRRSGSLDDAEAAFLARFGG